MINLKKKELPPTITTFIFKLGEMKKTKPVIRQREIVESLKEVFPSKVIHVMEKYLFDNDRKSLSIVGITKSLKDSKLTISELIKKLDGYK